MKNYKEFKVYLEKSKHILVIQADNPDGDSLASALALEAMLNEMDKTVTLICAVDIPAHLKYLSGWDRVSKDIPSSFDLSIIVDNSTETLFENADKRRGFEWIKTKPVIVLDHHQTSSGLSYSNLSLIEPVVSTGELIHKIAVSIDLPLPIDACELIAVSIMSDSLGLTTSSTTPDSFRAMADLVERGVDIAKLDAARRELMKKEPILLSYKGELLQRITLDCDGQLASIVIPWKEIEKYSHIYNPTMLVIDDMRLTVGVKVAIGYKVYSDGKITAKIRCNFGSPIADTLAKNFGGGGHPYAAGFKLLNGNTSIDELKNKVIEKVNQLLSELEDKSETV